MEVSSRGIYEKTRMDLVENWFKDLVKANDLLLEEANILVFTACDGAHVTPNDKIRRLELLVACVRHNSRLAARGEKLRTEIFKDAAEALEKYRHFLQACEKQLQDMPKAGF